MQTFIETPAAVPRTCFDSFFRAKCKLDLDVQDGNVWNGMHLYCLVNMTLFTVHYHTKMSNIMHYVMMDLSNCLCYVVFHSAVSGSYVLVLMLKTNWLRLHFESSFCVT